MLMHPIPVGFFKTGILVMQNRNTGNTGISTGFDFFSYVLINATNDFILFKV